MTDEIVSAKRAREIAKSNRNWTLSRIKIAYHSGKINQWFPSIDPETIKFLLDNGYKVEEIKPTEDYTDPFPDNSTYLLVSW